MRKGAGEYTDLVVRTLPSGQMATVRVENKALELFGWAKHYDTLQQHLVSLHGINGWSHAARSQTRRKRPSGRTFKIITNLPEGSGKKTWSSSVYVGSKLSNFDIAELAHFIECDWHYLVGPDGARKPRQWWESAYQKGPHGASNDERRLWKEVLITPVPAVTG